MSVKEVHEIDRFDVRSEDGKYATTIVVLQDFITAGTWNDPNAILPGLKEARTIEGFACNRIDDNTFEIVTDLRHPKMIVKRI